MRPALALEWREETELLWATEGRSSASFRNQPGPGRGGLLWRSKIDVVRGSAMSVVSETD